MAAPAHSSIQCPCRSECDIFWSTLSGGELFNCCDPRGMDTNRRQLRSMNCVQFSPTTDSQCPPVCPVAELRSRSSCERAIRSAGKEHVKCRQFVVWRAHPSPFSRPTFCGMESRDPLKPVEQSGGRSRLFPLPVQTDSTGSRSPLHPPTTHPSENFIPHTHAHTHTHSPTHTLPKS